jgi:hypothetical protein
LWVVSSTAIVVAVMAVANVMYVVAVVVADVLDFVYVVVER